MINRDRSKYLQAIAEHQSISKAAEALYMSQPSLSRFLKNLAKELGVKLFERTIPMHPTQAGEKYLEYVRRFQLLEDEMMAELAKITPAATPTLSVSALTFLCTYAVPKIIPAFAREFPNVDIHIKELKANMLTSTLNSGETDVFLTNLLQPYLRDKYSYQILSQDPIMLVAAKSYLEERGYAVNQVNSPMSPYNIDLKTLEHETFIVLHPWQNMRVAAEKIFHHYGMAPTKIIEAPSLSSAVSLVSSNKGITFVCRSSLYPIRPVTPLVYLSAGRMSDITAIFAVYKHDNDTPLIRSFCTRASSALKSAMN